MDGDDDDADFIFEGVGELFGFAFAGAFASDGQYDAVGVLELVDGVLQLAIEDGAIGDDNDRAEEFVVCCFYGRCFCWGLCIEVCCSFLTSSFIKRRQLMGAPGDGVGLARSGAVLNQVAIAGAFVAGGVDDFVDDFPLVIARKYQGLFDFYAAVKVFFFVFL